MTICRKNDKNISDFYVIENVLTRAESQYGVWKKERLSRRLILSFCSITVVRFVRNVSVAFGKCLSLPATSRYGKTFFWHVKTMAAIGNGREDWLSEDDRFIKKTKLSHNYNTVEKNVRVNYNSFL